MLRIGAYVPHISGMSGLGVVGRTEDEEFVKQLTGIRASPSEENLDHMRGDSSHAILPQIDSGKNIGMQLQAEAHNHLVMNA